MDFLKKLFGKKKPYAPPPEESIDYSQYFNNEMLGGMPLEIVSLGDINLPTGYVIAADPLVYLDESQPYSKSVKPGHYPVQACVASVDEYDQRIAAVRIQFRKEPALQWVLAVTDEKVHQSKNEADRFEGFVVDAGIASFCDLQTQVFYTEFTDEYCREHPDGNIYDDFFAPAFKKNAKDQNNPNDRGEWLNFQLPNEPSFNVVMFHSGWGDGVYPSYWGMNEKNEICSLVVDLGVL